MKKPRSGSALARFITTLSPDRRPVQTGFPTSLADLYVRNQSRLKKPSRRKRHGTGTNSSVSCCMYGPDSATSPQMDVERNRQEVLGCERICVCERKGFLGVGFLMVLLLLGICGKNLVLGFTAFAIFMRVWDLVGTDLVRFLKPCVEARRNVNLEVVCPIQEIEFQSQIGDDSSRSSVFESSDLCEVTLVTSNSKRKNLVKELFMNRRKKKCEERAESLDGSGWCQEIESVVEFNSEKVEDESANLIIEDQAEDLKLGSSQNSEMRGVSWLLIVFVMIMFGLMEGKAIAIILTICCSISLYLVGVVRSNKGRERIDGL